MRDLLRNVNRGEPDYLPTRKGNRWTEGSKQTDLKDSRVDMELVSVLFPHQQKKISNQRVDRQTEVCFRSTETKNEILDFSPVSSLLFLRMVNNSRILHDLRYNLWCVRNRVKKKGSFVVSGLKGQVFD